MQELIKQKLSEIEQQYGVQILFASETGSRAWGFPSPDSDYDVRFIYRHTRDWYLSIHEQRDTIEYLSGELDLVGWDIRKSLRLLRTALCSLWIVERNGIPPLAFRELLPLVKEHFLRDKIEALLVLKAQVRESYRHPKETELELYLKSILDDCDARANYVDKHQGETEPLNELFRKTIATPWH